MKFLVANYSCLQNPWLGGYRPQIAVLSVLNWICWTPPRKNSWVRHCLSAVKRNIFSGTTLNDGYLGAVDKDEELWTQDQILPSVTEGAPWRSWLLWWLLIKMWGWTPGRTDWLTFSCSWLRFNLSSIAVNSLGDCIVSQSVGKKTCMYIYMYVCVCVCMYIYVCVCVIWYVC
jgi:hypothetical protein